MAFEKSRTLMSREVVPNSTNLAQRQRPFLLKPISKFQQIIKSFFTIDIQIPPSFFPYTSAHRSRIDIGVHLRHCEFTCAVTIGHSGHAPPMLRTLARPSSAARVTHSFHDLLLSLNRLPAHHCPLRASTLCLLYPFFGSCVWVSFWGWIVRIRVRLRWFSFDFSLEMFNLSSYLDYAMYIG